MFSYLWIQRVFVSLGSNPNLLRHRRVRVPLTADDRRLYPLAYRCSSAPSSTIIMSSKRPAGSLGSLVSQSSKEAKRSATDRPTSAANHAASYTSGSNPQRNPFLSRPTQPEDAIKIFLIHARSIARRQQAANNASSNIEIEARLGTLLSPLGTHDMRALSSGPKLVPIQGKERVAHAFICNVRDNVTQHHPQNQPSTNFEGGITRSNYLRWTQAGLSEFSPLRYESRVAGIVYFCNSFPSQCLIESPFDISEL